MTTSSLHEAAERHAHETVESRLAEVDGYGR